MTFDFEILPDDIIAYNLYLIRHMPQVRQAHIRACVPWIIIAIVAFIITLLSLQPLPLLAIFAATTFIVSTIIVINHIFFANHYMKKIIQKQVSQGLYQKVLGQQSMTITPDSYTCTSAFSEVKRPWQTTEGIGITDDHAFIFADKTYAEIVPKHSFNSEVEWKNFTDQIQSNYAAAQHMIPKEQLS